MNRQEKIAFATEYCRELAARHPQIVGIALGGSLARGNDLPISDVDLWCFVDGDAGSLPVEKHTAWGLYLDIEVYGADLLTQLETARDPYLCGFLHDARILLDRDGRLGACQQRARAYIASPQFRTSQLCAIRASVERNYREFGAAIEAWDAAETCRASIFAAWSLCDHTLTDRAVAPGGSRGLARLAAVWPEAASAVVAFEGSAGVDRSRETRLIDTYLTVADASPFFGAWLQKVEWMFAHGHRRDALHALWIALGLRIKDGRGASDSNIRTRLAVASSTWLKIIGWDQVTARGKRLQLRRMIDRFCRSSSSSQPPRRTGSPPN